jgi:hypothetical protein
MRSHASAMKRGQAHCFLISLGHNRVRNQALIATSDLYGAVNHRLAMKLLFDRIRRRWIDLATVEFYRQLKFKSSKGDSDAAPRFAKCSLGWSLPAHLLSLSALLSGLSLYRPAHVRMRWLVALFLCWLSAGQADGIFTAYLLSYAASGVSLSPSTRS